MCHEQRQFAYTNWLLTENTVVPVLVLFLAILKKRVKRTVHMVCVLIIVCVLLRAVVVVAGGDRGLLIGCRTGGY